MKDNRSFFEKLTGAVRIDDDMEDEIETPSPLPARSGIRPPTPGIQKNTTGGEETWYDEPIEEGELTVDVYQTPTEIVIKSMVAGVRPEDLDIAITRDMVTIKGKRETERTIAEDDYFHKELYWGSFSRTIMLPSEIDVEESDAIEKHGLLIIRMPKLDKHRQTRLKVKG